MVKSTVTTRRQAARNRTDKLTSGFITSGESFWLVSTISDIFSVFYNCTVHTLSAIAILLVLYLVMRYNQTVMFNG